MSEIPNGPDNGKEAKAIARRHGKWSDKGVPHKGWSQVDFDDLGSPQETCEMCESQEIRYVHIVHHADYPKDLRVGCVCAEHLTEDLITPRKYEATAKSLARQRRNWPKRKWKMSTKGNPHTSIENLHFTVFSQGSGWKIVVDDGVGPKRYFRKIYQSMEEAKFACFEMYAAVKLRNSS